MLLAQPGKYTLKADLSDIERRFGYGFRNNLDLMGINSFFEEGFWAWQQILESHLLSLSEPLGWFQQENAPYHVNQRNSF